MDKIQPNAPVTNSTCEYNDLDAVQLAQLYQENLGSKPERARKSDGSESRQKAHAQYRKAVTSAADNAAQPRGRRQAKSSDVVKPSSEQPQDDSEQVVHGEEDAGEFDATRLLPFSPHSGHANLLSQPMAMPPALPDPPETLYFFYTNSPFTPVESMTIYHAVLHPFIDRSDTRNKFPETQEEHDALYAALRVTIEDSRTRMGCVPLFPTFGNYATIYQAISSQCRPFNGVFPALSHRTKWTGRLDEWRTGGIESGLGQ